MDLVNCRTHNTKAKPKYKIKEQRVLIDQRLLKYRLKNKKVLCPECNPVSVYKKELQEGKH